MKIDFLSLEQKKLNGIIVVASKAQVSADLGEEAVILGLSSGVYFGLNEVGLRIWNLLKEPRSVRDILDILMNEYEVENNQCEQDLRSLLQDLQDNGLIEIKSEKS
jgi:hypothetical protein